MTELLDHHPAVIVVEDDLVTVPSFLPFMNAALQTYADTPHVFSSRVQLSAAYSSGLSGRRLSVVSQLVLGVGNVAGPLEQGRLASADFDRLLTDRTEQQRFAIRKAVGMEAAPDDPAHRRSYLAGVGRLLDGVQPAEINFGSLLAERASAKRLFMLCVQILKYVDATTPIRFLIAECETSFTLLAALYFARLFGIADRLDISPLFETTKAFERGVKVIEDCLGNPHYAAYVRGRGRLCIQMGFSDAGRHLGQTTVFLFTPQFLCC